MQAAALKAARSYGLLVLAGGALLLALWVSVPILMRRIRTAMRLRAVSRGAVAVSDATLLYDRMLRLLRRRGYQKPASLTPAEFASSLPQSPLAQSVTVFTGAYHALRYGGRREAAVRMLSILADLDGRAQRAGAAAVNGDT